MTDFKTKILFECKRVLDEKINQLSAALNEVTEASNSESKSSAGDKHETTKAMMQIEQEKLSKQLSELNTQKNELDKIVIHNSSNINQGSLIETNNGTFFIAISLGKIKAEGKDVFVISNQSPIGKQLLNLNGNKHFELNNVKYEVMSVS
jgi:hypothetical protein